MDSQELFFSSRECDIYYNPELNTVPLIWKGFYSSGEPFRKIMDVMIQLLRQKKSSVIIADAREMKIISGNDQE